MAKKPTTIDAKYNKTQILDAIAENTELSRKQVSSVLEELGNVIGLHIKKKSVGEFVLQVVSASFDCGFVVSLSYVTSG